MEEDFDFEKPLDKQGYINGNKLIKFNENAMLRRKIRVEHLFKNLGFKVRLIGNPNTPAIIVDESICVSAYMHNFNLIFTDIPSHGNQIYKLKLEHNPNIIADEIYRVLMTSQHRPVFCIRYGSTDLYLAGYNFIDKKTNFGKYPVFARKGKGTKIYFDIEYAESICALFNDTYDLQIEHPQPIDFQRKFEDLKKQNPIKPGE